MINISFNIICFQQIKVWVCVILSCFYRAYQIYNITGGRGEYQFSQKKTVLLQHRINLYYRWRKFQTVTEIFDFVFLSLTSLSLLINLCIFFIYGFVFFMTLRMVYIICLYLTRLTHFMNIKQHSLHWCLYSRNKISQPFI